MEVLLAVYIFVIGLAFGSFALVLVDRIRTDRDWVKGRSRCESCKVVLEPRDLIPLFSWLVQRGRCRMCKANIGASYPLTELLTGIFFVVSYVFLPYELSSVVSVVLFATWLVALVAMTALFVYDLRWKLLPTNLLVFTIFLGLIHAVLYYWQVDSTLLRYTGSLVLSVLVGGGIFYLLYAYSKGKWIGSGDIYIGVFLGLFLADPIRSWLAIFVSSLIAIVYSVFSTIHTSKKLKVKIPFGPFLILGLIISYLFGADIIDWYSETFLYL